MNPFALAVARWRNPKTTRLEKAVTAILIAVLIGLGGSLLWNGSRAALALAHDPSCSAELPKLGPSFGFEAEPARAGACTTEVMDIANVHFEHARNADYPYIVLESRGRSYDLEIDGKDRYAVFHRLLDQHGKGALVKTLYGEPIALQSAVGRVTFATHPDGWLTALGGFMLAGGCASLFFGPGRQRIGRRV